MKAFLFGGDSNGQVFEVENHIKHISRPKEVKQMPYSEFSEHARATVNFERYVKYDEIFRKKLSNSGAVIEMEDLGIFIHESFTQGEIESLSKIILMVIRAQWKPSR